MPRLKGDHANACFNCQLQPHLPSSFKEDMCPLPAGAAKQQRLPALSLKQTAFKCSCQARSSIKKKAIQQYMQACDSLLLQPSASVVLSQWLPFELQDRVHEWRDPVCGESFVQVAAVQHCRISTLVPVSGTHPHRMAVILLSCMKALKGNPTTEAKHYV